MEKTTYKFTAFVETFHKSLNRPVRYYAGVNTPSEALSWINEMSQAGPLESIFPLVSFGFYETKNEK